MYCLSPEEDRSMDPSPIMDSFEFKQHLFRIANGLSTSDVKGMKFLLQAGRGYIQRRQAERIKSGFELLCVLAEKNYVAPAETGLLAYLLEDAHKSHLLQPLLAELGATPRPARESAPPGVVADPSLKLDWRFKELLKNLGERLSEREFRSLVLFYADEYFPLQEMEELKQPIDLFEKLNARQVITVTDLRKLLVVFRLIGREDLCKLVNDYIIATKDYVNTRNPGPKIPPLHREGVERTVVPTEEQSYPSSADSLAFHRSSSHSGPPSSLFSDTIVSQSATPSSSTPTSQSATPSSSNPTPQSAAPSSSNPTSQSTTPPPSNPASQDATPSNPQRTTMECTESSDPVLDVRGGQLVALGRKAEFGRPDAGEKVSHPEQDSDSRGQDLDRDAMACGARGDAHCPAESAQEREGMGSSRYDMSCSPHGIALVIMNDQFEPNELELSHRLHGQSDLKHFCETFTKLGYDVQHHTNLTASKIREMLRGIASCDHSVYDSFVCCVSTHGQEDIIYGSDSRSVYLSTDFVTPVKQCETLRKKPKLFFVQSCRVLPSPSTDLVTADSPLHLDADVFIAMATTSGESAYGTGSGSWFVDTLKKVFTEASQTTDLSHMMHSVTGIICDKEGHQKREDGTHEQVRQCSEIRSTLRASVQFSRQHAAV